MPVFGLRTVRPLFSVIIISFLFSFPTLATAWNAMGHMVVASIAYQQLKPHAKATVDDLVKVFHQEYPEINSFEQMAYWLDTLRSQDVMIFSHWHYIDSGITTDGTPIQNMVDTDNGVWAIKNITPVIQNKHANPYERARFLAFFIHIIGDMHQPLHTVTLFSANHVNGDRGGNDYFVTYRGDHKNLHALWDSGVGQYDNTVNVSTAKSIAMRQMNVYPVGLFGDLVHHTEPSLWSAEGESRAKQIAYNTPEGKAVSDTYVSQGQQTAAEATTLAGYRLADVLNTLLD